MSDGADGFILRTILRDYCPAIRTSFQYLSRVLSATPTQPGHWCSLTDTAPRAAPPALARGVPAATRDCIYVYGPRATHTHRQSDRRQPSRKPPAVAP
eukprot:COSAG02_NODE_3343_length_6898_cov_9.593617_4_plen_98_part_00